MFAPPKQPKPSEQIAKYYRSRFKIGFRNHAAADANPGFFPCPLVASLSDDYYYGSMMSGVLTPDEMDAVAAKFDKELGNVARRDNHEELRACILERLWLEPYGKMRKEQRKRAEKEKQRREYNARVQILKERELKKKAREQAAAMEEYVARWNDVARWNEVERLAKCPIWRRDNRGQYEVRPDGSEELTFEANYIELDDAGEKEIIGDDEEFWEEEWLLKEALEKRAAEELEEGEVEESPRVKQERRLPFLAPKRGRAAATSWRAAAGAKKRPRVIQDDDSD